VFTLIQEFDLVSRSKGLSILSFQKKYNKLLVTDFVKPKVSIILSSFFLYYLSNCFN